MKALDQLRRPAVAIFLVVTLACGWFYAQGSWNQNARYDMIYSFVEPGTPDFLTFRIDHFHIIWKGKKTFNTGDWAFHDGHYYSNKAPGASLLGIPVYAALYWLEYPFHRGEIPVGLDMFNAWAINFAVSVLPVAAAAVAFFKTLLLLGFGKRRAVFWSLTLVLATPIWPYSTMMWGHPLAAAALVFALYRRVRQQKYDLYFCGLWCGFAVLTDYLAAPAAVAFGVYSLWRSPKTVWRFAAGGLPMLVVFAAYHYWCFGAPFTPATVFNNPMFLEPDKVGGVLGAFSPAVAWKLLFGVQRGIFLFSPLLLAAVPGFFAWLKRDRAAAWCAAGAFLAALFVNAGFNGWHGGNSTCARYLIPLLPCLVFLAAAWNPRSRAVRRGILVVAAFSCFNMLTIASATPMLKESVRNPLYGASYDLFFSGANRLMPIDGIRFYIAQPEWAHWFRWSSFSAGTLAGLSAPVSLIVFLGLLLAAALPLLPVRIRRRPAPPPPGPERGER